MDCKNVHFVDDEAAEGDAAEGACTALQVFHTTYGVLPCADGGNSRGDQQGNGGARLSLREKAKTLTCVPRNDTVRA